MSQRPLASTTHGRLNLEQQRKRAKELWGGGRFGTGEEVGGKKRDYPRQNELSQVDQGFPACTSYQLNPESVPKTR